MRLDQFRVRLLNIRPHQPLPDPQAHLPQIVPEGHDIGSISQDKRSGLTGSDTAAGVDSGKVHVSKIGASVPGLLLAGLVQFGFQLALYSPYGIPVSLTVSDDV